MSLTELMEFQYSPGSTPSNTEVDFGILQEYIDMGGELKFIGHLLHVRYFILHNFKIT